MAYTGNLLFITLQSCIICSAAYSLTNEFVSRGNFQCRPIFNCTPGHEIKPCNAPYGDERCEKCTGKFVQPFWISSFDDERSCFQSRDRDNCVSEAHMPRRNASKIFRPRFCQCNIYNCFLDKDSVCVRDKGGGCPANKTLSPDGNCVPCPKFTFKLHRGCGPCLTDIAQWRQQFKPIKLRTHPPKFSSTAGSSNQTTKIDITNPSIIWSSSPSHRPSKSETKESTTYTMQTRDNIDLIINSSSGYLHLSKSKMEGIQDNADVTSIIVVSLSIALVIASAVVVAVVVCRRKSKRNRNREETESLDKSTRLEVKIPVVINMRSKKKGAEALSRKTEDEESQKPSSSLLSTYTSTDNNGYQTVSQPSDLTDEKCKLATSASYPPSYQTQISVESETRRMSGGHSFTSIDTETIPSYAGSYMPVRQTPIEHTENVVDDAGVSHSTDLKTL